MKKVMVTGGGGYVGTLLTYQLLKKNYEVVVVDTFWFGNFLTKHKSLTVLKKNILNLKNSDFKNVDYIIHLASIANDNAADIDPNLTWETSCLGTKILCDFAKKNKISFDKILIEKGCIHIQFNLNDKDNKNSSEKKYENK